MYLNIKFDNVFLFNAILQLNK